MGTRADYYIGYPELQWLGSTAYDGYPPCMMTSAVTRELFDAHSQEGYLLAVAVVLEAHHATMPEQGWPWPWNDSGTTDYAYMFHDGRTWVSHFGRPWIAAAAWDKYVAALDSAEDDDHDDDDPLQALDSSDYISELKFPDMSARKKVTLGPRSGLLVLSND